MKKRIVAIEEHRGTKELTYIASKSWGARKHALWRNPKASIAVLDSVPRQGLYPMPHLQVEPNPTAYLLLPGIVHRPFLGLVAPFKW